MSSQMLPSRSLRLSVSYSRGIRFLSGLAVLWVAILGFPLQAAAAERIRIAVAANFLQATKELAAEFEKQTGIRVEATFASSGSLYAQIANGAPYDLFLSADEERPAKLHREGNADKPFVYARGRVVLWSARKSSCSATDWRQALADPAIRKIAVANPETAPYGAAARAALQKAGLWESGQQKRVVAQTIAQAFQYASTGALDVAFCAFSSVVSEQGRKGCHYEIPEAPEIVQAACIVKQTQNRAGAERFAAFLLSAPAAGIKDKYGYR